jgi:putative inorganic carbon (HCO3(-)) transporter
MTSGSTRRAINGFIVRLSTVSRWLTGFEWLVVMAIAPLLLFPTAYPHWTVAALILLGILWLLCRESLPVTPFNGALFLFALMIPIAIWTSALPELTLPKASGLVLGLAVFRAITLTVHNRRSLGLALVAFCLLGGAIVAVGAAGANWPTKVRFLSSLAGFIPRLIPSLPGMPEVGIQANQIAGILTLYLPLAVALVFGGLTKHKAQSYRQLSLAGGMVFLVITASILLLTQSRAGWIGSVAGLLTLGALWGLSGRRRWMRLAGAALPLLALAAVAALLLAIGPQPVGEVLYAPDTVSEAENVVGEITLAGRVEIWNRALYAIQDFPFTGCGLGTFRRVVHILYPLFLTSPDFDIAHAHNIFLQTALDLGLPGLIAYLALLGIAGATCWRCARHSDPLVRATALGLAAGLVGLHVYGLADALALGSKPGVAFWFALGLIAALPRIARQEMPKDASISRITDHRSSITPRALRFTRYVRTHPWLIALAAFLTLVLLATSVYLGWRAFQEAPFAQPSIRLPLYPGAQETDVHTENPAVDAGWSGELEVATFSTADSLADVAAFYTDAIAAGGWQIEAEAGDETSWGGIYTKNGGLSVCLLNAFDIEGQSWVSIVCGDKLEPVDILPPPAH